jgi:hypothetical protein
VKANSFITIFVGYKLNYQRFLIILFIMATNQNEIEIAGPEASPN